MLKLISLAHFNVDNLEDVYRWLAIRYYQTGYIRAKQVEIGYNKKRNLVNYRLKIEFSIRVKSKKEGLLLTEYLGCGHTYIRRSKKWNTYRWSLNGAKNIYKVIKGVLENYPPVVDEKDEIRVRRLGIVQNMLWDTVINRKEGFLREREEYIKELEKVKAPKMWKDYSQYFRRR